MHLITSTTAHGPIQGLFIRDHGGNCCGVNHLDSFPPLTAAMFGVTDEQRRKWIKSAVDEAIEGYDLCDDLDCGCSRCGVGYDEWRTAIEVVLVKSQLTEWRKPLEDCGFKEVFSFHNTNSGNRCHVFFLETNA